MELSLQRVFDCNQCSVIRFLTAKHTSAAEIHQQLSMVYGKETMSVQHVRKWVHDFSNRRDVAASFRNLTRSFMNVV